jgi:hypothetical protein
LISRVRNYEINSNSYHITKDELENVLKNEKNVQSCQNKKQYQENFLMQNEKTLFSTPKTDINCDKVIKNRNGENDRTEVLEQLKQSINKTRTKIHYLISKRKCLLMTDEILKASQELDELIKIYLQKQIKKNDD